MLGLGRGRHQNALLQPTDAKFLHQDDDLDDLYGDLYGDLDDLYGDLGDCFTSVRESCWHVATHDSSMSTILYQEYFVYTFTFIQLHNKGRRPKKTDI